MTSYRSRRQQITMNRKPLRNCVVPKTSLNGIRTFFFNTSCPCRVDQKHVDAKFKFESRNIFDEKDKENIQTIISLEAD